MELTTAYRQVPKIRQPPYAVAVAAAKKAYPSAWTSAPAFAKRAGRSSDAFWVREYPREPT
jgi:hypothetical protein